MKVKGLCRHCGLTPRCRPRGLCWTCFFTPGVKERYPKRHAFKGFGLGNYKRPPPTEPTAAPPGSPEKVEVLAARAAADVGLWHPDDSPKHVQPCRCGACLGWRDDTEGILTDDGTY